MNELEQAVADLVDVTLAVHEPADLAEIDLTELNPADPLDVLGYLHWWVLSYGLDEPPVPACEAARDRYLAAAKADTRRRRQTAASN